MLTTAADRLIAVLAADPGITSQGFHDPRANDYDQRRAQMFTLESVAEFERAMDFIATVPRRKTPDRKYSVDDWRFPARRFHRNRAGIYARYATTVDSYLDDLGVCCISRGAMLAACVASGLLLRFDRYSGQFHTNLSAKAWESIMDRNRPP